MLALAAPLLEQLEKSAPLIELSIVGSVRRMCETVRNLNLLCAAAPAAACEIGDRFKQLPPVAEVIEQSASSTTRMRCWRSLILWSGHSAFRQPKEQMTARILAAMQNKYVHMIAYPTGRLLSGRPGFEVDLEQIFKTAAATGTVIEMNCTPNRLDLNDQAARRASEFGVKLAINTDTHEIDELASMRLGVATARRAWLTPDDVINT